MHKWLFCFQKSVALVLTHLMRSSERRSPYEVVRTTSHKTLLTTPDKVPHRQSGEHNISGSGWTGAQSLHPSGGLLSSDEVHAAFRRHDERAAGRDQDRHLGRHSEGGDSPSKHSTGSAAIPIQPQQPKSAQGSGHLHGHGHGQQAHSHSRSRAQSSLRSASHDGHSGSTSRNLSVDKVATSYKEDDDEHLRLEELLHTPSDGSDRSRSHSEGGRSEESEGDLQGDWHSRGSNEMPDDDEEDLMFDLDETAETRRSTSERQPQQHMTSSGYSQTSQSRTHSSESTGPGGSFFSVGKALALSMALGSGADHKSPSRRSSHTSHGSSHSSHAAAYSPPHGTLGGRVDGTSPSTVPFASHHHHTPGAAPTASSSLAHLRRQNDSDYLMWESGYCSKSGIRESQEDRFACSPNINEHIRQAASSSGAVSGARSVQATLVLSGSATNGSPNSKVGATHSHSGGSIGGGVEGAGGYFGVYDGHGGQAAAIYVEKYLMENICLHPEFTDNLQKAVTESCIRTDQDFLVSPRSGAQYVASVYFLFYAFMQAECDAKRIYCGTTALGAFVIGSSLMVFNIGDCQAVLCSAGNAVSPLCKLRR
jgi:hypothetical protein